MARSPGFGLYIPFEGLSLTVLHNLTEQNLVWLRAAENTMLSPLAKSAEKANVKSQFNFVDGLKDGKKKLTQTPSRALS